MLTEGILVLTGLLCVVVWILGQRATNGRYRFLAWLGIVGVLVVAGFFTGPAWYGLAATPIVGIVLIIKPRPKEQAWHVGSKMAGPTGQIRQAEHLAEGKCPDCGAKNAPEVARCKVCNRFLRAL